MKYNILPAVEYKEDEKEKGYKSPIEKKIKRKKKIEDKNKIKFLLDKNNLVAYH